MFSFGSVPLSSFTVVVILGDLYYTVDLLRGSHLTSPFCFPISSVNFDAVFVFTRCF